MLVTNLRVCAQHVKVKAYWSAGTVSVFHQRSTVMVRKTVRMAAMRSNAAESRVRHLSVTPSPVSFCRLEPPSSLFAVFQLKQLVSPDSPAVSPLLVHQRVGGATLPATTETITAVSHHSVCAATEWHVVCKQMIFPLERSKLQSETLINTHTYCSSLRFSKKKSFS